MRSVSRDITEESRTWAWRSVLSSSLAPVMSQVVTLIWTSVHDQVVSGVSLVIEDQREEEFSVQKIR
jgi:hypothetical protein